MTPPHTSVKKGRLKILGRDRKLTNFSRRSFVCFFFDLFHGYTVINGYDQFFWYLGEVLFVFLFNGFDHLFFFGGASIYFVFFVWFHGFDHLFLVGLV